ncbi:ribose-phosphate pyrophosphokinase [Candidatus Woesearchaeota archaeon]|nr:ribose-phosphate pyrophosphokinase [Candidatus Woesearchaeota archaeon]
MSTKMECPYYYGINRGEFALVACRNGQKTANIIKSHLEDICKEREELINGMDQDKLLSHPGYDYFMRQLQFINHVNRNNGVKVIETEIKDFKDGEVKPKLVNSIAGKDVYIVQNSLDPRHPSETDHNIVELMLMLNTVKSAGAGNTSVIMPYMSYSKQDRRTGREPDSAMAILKVIQTMGAQRFFSMDLHAPAITGFSDPNKMIINNLYASSILMNYFEDKGLDMWVAPDTGAGKMVRHFTKVTGLPMALGYKYRSPDSSHEVEEQELLGYVEGMRVGIIDDQSAGSTTLIGMAKKCKENGATYIVGGVSHGLLLDDAEFKYRKAVKEGVLDELVITNTLIQPDEFINNNPYLKVLDALKFFAEAIFETHVSGSISRLYQPTLRKSMFGENHKI